MKVKSIKNPGGRLKYHKDPKLKWIKCRNCKKGKVPNDMHAYWHSIGGMKGLQYECPNCEQVRYYNPTFDATIII